MVKKHFLLPQEIETFYVIPTLRRYIAMALKERGMKQKDIAGLLQINSATISQYASSKRGHKIDFSEEVIVRVKEAAGRIKDHFTYIQEMQRLLLIIRKTNVLCLIHKQFSDVPLQCEPLAIGCAVEIQ